LRSKRLTGDVLQGKTRKAMQRHCQFKSEAVPFLRFYNDTQWVSAFIHYIGARDRLTQSACFLRSKRLTGVFLTKGKNRKAMQGYCWFKSEAVPFLRFCADTQWVSAFIHYWREG